MNDTTPLEPGVLDLARGANFCVVSTHMPDGSIQSQPVWVDADDDGHLLVNTETGRQRYRNLGRDPRVTVLIVEDGNWYHHAEVRGRVVEAVTGPAAREHIDALSRKYTGADYANPIGTERVILRIAAEKQNLRA